MVWYRWIALFSLVIFLVNSLYHILLLVRQGRPKEYSPPAGRIVPAIQYSFTGAMNPAKKESAFLHLPTYAAGLIYHLGSFLSILLFFMIWIGISFPHVISSIISYFLLISVTCGFGILIKRIVKKGLRDLSSMDDYISNLLVTSFQSVTALTLITELSLAAYFITASLLLLYFPVGKLKHVIYFFAARYHLGLFYGWRGIWPPKTEGKGISDG